MLKILFSCAMLICSNAFASDFDYALTPQKITEGVFYFEGANEDFTFKNGGNILNVGVIITSEGVVLVNSGPSLLYGEQLKAAVAKLTDKPVVRIYISKLHPDHFLGNQAFDGIPIYTLAQTRELIQQHAGQFTDNMYRLVGSWMKGTEATMPTHTAKAGEVTIGDRTLQIIDAAGHTPGDLILLDKKSGTLFTGGVVFHDRAPTTPNADLKLWKKELEMLSKIKFNYLLPSHGPLAKDDYPIKQTFAYVDWLDRHFENATNGGASMAEAMYSRLPPEYSEYAVMPSEYHRSVSHLYASYEASQLPLLNEGGY